MQKKTHAIGSGDISHTSLDRRRCVPATRRGRHPNRPHKGISRKRSWNLPQKHWFPTFRRLPQNRRDPGLTVLSVCANPTNAKNIRALSDFSLGDQNWLSEMQSGRPRKPSRRCSLLLRDLLAADDAGPRARAAGNRQLSCRICVAVWRVVIWSRNYYARLSLSRFVQFCATGPAPEMIRVHQHRLDVLHRIARICM